MKRIVCLSMILVCAVLSLWSRPKALIKTNLGDIQVILYADSAPVTVSNFIKYAEEGLYDGVVIHRVIRGFIMQSGGYTLTESFLQPIRTYPPIISEADNGLYNIKGTIAMARIGLDPDSATSQFYINLASNPDLNYKGEGSKKDSYTVFGKVCSGWDVLKKIENVKTRKKGPFKKFPTVNIRIETVIIVREEGE